MPGTVRRHRWPGWVSFGLLLVASVPVGVLDLVLMLFGQDNCGAGSDGSNPLCRSGPFVLYTFGPLLASALALVLALVMAIRPRRWSWVGHLLAWLMACAGAALLASYFTR